MKRMVKPFAKEIHPPGLCSEVIFVLGKHAKVFPEGVCEAPLSH